MTKLGFPNEEEQMLYKTLIIDDEALARKRLKRLLTAFSNQFAVMGEATDGPDAVEKIDKLKPDCIFLDIQMPGFDGFEVLKKIKHQPLVIFCTAYDDYAVKAFETFSVDYLLKPVEQERLEITIKKLQNLDSYNSNMAKLLHSIENFLPKEEVTSIPCRVGDRVILIKLENVVYFQAEDKYVAYYDTHGKSYLTEQSLKTLEEKLPDYFIRVSKSLIVNKQKILEYRKYFKGKYILILDDHKRTQLYSGSTFSQHVRALFDF
jgi:two-component system LytT family response regulator